MNLVDEAREWEHTSMPSRWSGKSTQIPLWTLFVAWVILISIECLKAHPSARKIPSRERGETPTGKLLNKLEEQNAGDWANRPHDWIRTLKEIADIGSSAVPELIQELDATTDGEMIRELTFVLRAIGDRRAVPALIRAIPRTLCRYVQGSRFNLDDHGLLSFAQKHDLSDKNEGNTFSFGQPIREMTQTLMLLTEHVDGAEDLFQVITDGTVRQRRLKEYRFHLAVRRWADWWEKDWERFTSDPAYSKVYLPDFDESNLIVPDLAADAHLKTMSGITNMILEPVQKPKGRWVFYDIDTGRIGSPPPKWGDGVTTEAQVEEIIAWATKEGFDLMGTTYVPPQGGRPIYALRGINLRAWELGMNHWKVKHKDITLESLQAEGRYTKEPLLIHFDSQKNDIDPLAVAPFLVITREGSPALIYLGVEVLELQKRGEARRDEDPEFNPFHLLFTGRRFAMSYLVDLNEPL